ncbi:MAG: hypothetical protein JSW11_00915 [Candidatus Heimdallarchaeota archaeon]|nr:MAG: hypothetical protein JSW11_00915 [Candidatus Heimdallarchaeota archaeon]
MNNSLNYDYWYNVWRNSKESSACIVRVTNKCDQQCRHCAFRSSPYNTGQISIDNCAKINKWLPEKIVMNIMGGEFSILHDYESILIALSQYRLKVGIVTNGFWSKNKHEISRFISTIKTITKTCNEVIVCVANDQWHKKYPQTESLLRKNKLDIEIQIKEELPIHKIVRIGRAWDNKINKSTSNHQSCRIMSNLTIIENGMITRCPYGYFPWRHFTETSWYDAQEYIWGWRSEKLSEGMTCSLCMECDYANTQNTIDSNNI